MKNEVYGVQVSALEIRKAIFDLAKRKGYSLGTIDNSLDLVYLRYEKGWPPSVGCCTAGSLTGSELVYITMDDFLERINEPAPRPPMSDAQRFIRLTAIFNSLKIRKFSSQYCIIDRVVWESASKSFLELMPRESVAV